MNEFIKHIADLMNIDISSKFSIDSIIEDLEGITDLNDFRKYLKANENYYGLDFKTGLAKFTILANKYKAQKAEEENADRLANGNKFALELSGKVKAVETHVLNFMIPDGKRDIDYADLISDGKPFFTAYETSELKKIGSLRRVVNLRRSQSGGDPLYERLADQAKKTITAKALGYEKTSRDVSGLLKNTIKRI